MKRFPSRAPGKRTTTTNVSTNWPAGTYDQVKLLYAVGLFRRLYGFLVKKWPLRKFLKDHSIGIYRRKLMVVAERRN